MVEGKRILIIGLGISGRSAAEFLLSQKAEVVGIDSSKELLQQNPEIARLRQKGLQTALEEEIVSLDRFQLVIVSPGIPPSHRLYSQAQKQRIDTIGEVELACRFFKGKCLGVTGTNGKTTVTLGVTHVLNTCGIVARALGNVGTPLTSICFSDPLRVGEIAVIELSSFQLETLSSPVLDEAVLLNITPDHLDRYPDFMGYARAKIQIANCIKEGGTLYIEHSCDQKFGHLLPAFPFKKAYGYCPKTCEISSDLRHLLVQNEVECLLPSAYQERESHDLENLMAIYALCRSVGVTSAQFSHAISSFRKPAHRIELVRIHQGVSFYDDSKGTNIDAVIRAVQSLQGNIILIAGGVDKGSSYTPWMAAFADKVKCICVIGQAAEKIHSELTPSFRVERFDTLESAVAFAACKAQPGENVLLSPGCSSFDMFCDYKHRGQEFQRLVKNLF